MKTLIAVSALTSAIASSLLSAADNNPASSAVDLPLTRIEVTVALKHYEKIRGLLMDADLDRKLQNLDSNVAKEVASALDKRIEMLTGELTKLRTFAEETLKAARDSLQRESVIAARIREQASIMDPDPQDGAALPLLPDPKEVGLAAHIAAKNEVGNYLVAKERCLKAKNHLEKLESICQ